MATKTKLPVKKALAKKAAPKKTVTKATTNKELDKMLATIAEARKTSAKSVLVFTTNREHHKANLGTNGFGAHDLKPKLLEAYKHLSCNFDVTPKMIDKFEVEWHVKLK